MTYRFTNQTSTRLNTARPALIGAVLIAAALIAATPVRTQTIAADVQPFGSSRESKVTTTLKGAWMMDYLGEGGSLSGRTSAIFTSDGSVFVQNTVPNILPGAIILHGTGEWVRSADGRFDLTWIYPVVSATNGSNMGMFKDRAKLLYSADGKTLEGRLTFQYTLPDGTVAFDGTSQMKLVRVRIEPLP